MWLKHYGSQYLHANHNVQDDKHWIYTVKNIIHDHHGLVPPLGFNPHELFATHQVFMTSGCNRPALASHPVMDQLMIGYGSSLRTELVPANGIRW